MPPIARHAGAASARLARSLILGGTNLRSELMVRDLIFAGFVAVALIIIIAAIT